MPITRETIDYLATLSRLQLTEKEQDQMVEEIGKIITYFDKLQELDTSSVNATDYLVIDEEVFEESLRDDVIGESFPREELLHPEEDRNSPFFTVPRVVE